MERDAPPLPSLRRHRAEWGDVRDQPEVQAVVAAGAPIVLAAALFLTWQVVPTRGSIQDVSLKVGWKRRLALASPRRRAPIAKELLRVYGKVQARFEEVTAPFLIVDVGRTWCRTPYARRSCT
ncbi:putative caffeoylshikimate esterase [Iris pallida]|uniref:Caffeoylshikimate esterase n=1 Tax=Iris pallida TaxID=29817 RepID=A0AAX6HGH7_IRIPA|nr:putative caffeoylshikimate esterase [Iris pallida]